MTETTTAKPHFNTIGIYGVGLMGGSLGLAVKQKWPECRIIGIGRNEARLKEAVLCGAVDEWSTEPAKISPPLDLLVLCTPVRLLAGHLQDCLPVLAPQAVITDVGSTKNNVVKACEEATPADFTFIGSHPMAGSHKSGIEAADQTLFDGKTCIVTPTDSTPTEPLEKIQCFWKTLNMQVIKMLPEQHDKLTSLSSHLPHLVAASLCQLAGNAGKDIFDVIGTGFLDTTRIAAGDPKIWIDICMENKEELFKALSTLQQDINQLQSIIEQGNEQELKIYLEQSKKFRDQFN